MNALGSVHSGNTSHSLLVSGREVNISLDKITDYGTHAPKGRHVHVLGTRRFTLMES